MNKKATEEGGGTKHTLTVEAARESSSGLVANTTIGARNGADGSEAGVRIFSSRPIRFDASNDFMRDGTGTRERSGGRKMPLTRPHAAVELRGSPTSVGALGCMDRADAMTAAGLHEQYLEVVFRYVLRRLSSLEEAEDVTAEVFAAAFLALPRFRGQCTPYLWLLSIARRKIIDARRRSARRETLASELSATSPEANALWEALVTVEGPEAALMRTEARQVLQALIARLSADQREALLLQSMEQLSVAEIAQVMGRSPASVKSLLQRARAAMYRQGRGYFLGTEGQGP
jgi:RNA polymerase sigma factor (sigma-70 family)